jgi:hypothetical protein
MNVLHKTIIFQEEIVYFGYTKDFLYTPKAKSLKDQNSSILSYQNYELLSEKHCCV